MKTLTSGIWKLENFARNIWKISVDVPASGYITMTGSDVSTELAIPFPHRWNSTHFRHATSVNVDSNDPLNITIRRSKGKNTPQQFEEELVFISKETAAKISDTWGEMFEREGGVYEVILNSTSTDLVYPVFYIQQLGD